MHGVAPVQHGPPIDPQSVVPPSGVDEPHDAEEFPASDCEKPALEQVTVHVEPLPVAVHVPSPAVSVPQRQRD